MAKLSDNELTAEQIESMVDEFGKKLEILRVRYEQYFIGVERVAPSVMRMDVVRLMRELERLKIRNTSVKFKLNSAIQKFNSYSAYWNRTIREIEDGVYMRHRQRAQRRHAGAEVFAPTHEIEAVEGPSDKKKEAPLSDLGREAEDFLKSLNLPDNIKIAEPARKIELEAQQSMGPKLGAIEGQRPQAQKATVPVRRPSIVGAAAVPSAPTPPKAADSIQNLYDDMNAARERLGLKPQNIGVDQFRKSIEHQNEMLQARHQAAHIEYEIVVKDNKPFLKPIIKK